MRKAGVYKALTLVWGMASVVVIIASLTMSGDFQPVAGTSIFGISVTVIFAVQAVKWNHWEHLLSIAIPNWRKEPSKPGSPEWIAALQPAAGKAITVAGALAKRRQEEYSAILKKPGRSELDLDFAEYVLYMAQLDERRLKKVLRSFGFRVPAAKSFASPLTTASYHKA